MQTGSASQHCAWGGAVREKFQIWKYERCFLFSLTLTQMSRPLPGCQHPANSVLLEFKSTSSLHQQQTKTRKSATQVLHYCLHWVCSVTVLFCSQKEKNNRTLIEHSHVYKAGAKCKEDSVDSSCSVSVPLDKCETDDWKNMTETL